MRRIQRKNTSLKRKNQKKEKKQKQQNNDILYDFIKGGGKTFQELINKAKEEDKDTIIDVMNEMSKVEEDDITKDAIIKKINYYRGEMPYVSNSFEMMSIQKQITLYTKFLDAYKKYENDDGGKRRRRRKKKSKKKKSKKKKGGRRKRTRRRSRRRR